MESTNSAIAQLGDGSGSGVRGSVEFVQRSDNEPTAITGEVRGLPIGTHEILIVPGNVPTKGNIVDLSNASLLGETKTDCSGVAKIDIVDREIRLTGPDAPIGDKLIITSGIASGDAKVFAQESVEMATITRPETQTDAYNPDVPKLNV